VVPTRAAKLSDEDLPVDTEGIFLRHAEKSLTHGTCDRFLLGLDDIASDPNRGKRAETARIFRARCFDSMMKVKEARLEFRRYLLEYPNGVHVDEARQGTED
jgi:hypothetical protein